MKFNRYLVAFLAGFESFSLAASLRKGSGGRRLNAEFNGLMQLLNTTYDGSCKTHTTGQDDPMATPMTLVHCHRPGGKATMIALGALGVDSVTPTHLRVCEVQVDAINRCSALKFTGNAVTDIQDVSALLKGLLTTRKLGGNQKKSSSEFDGMVKGLNSTYGGTCQIYVVGGVVIDGHKSEITTNVDCVIPGGAAYLVATGDPASPTPHSLETCSFGDEMRETCRYVKFSGDAKEDSDEFTKLVGSKGGDRKLADGRSSQGSDSVIMGTDFDMLVQLLNGAYHDECEITVVGLKPEQMTTFVSCSRPGSEAKLAAQGPTHNPVPTALQVCDVRANMKPHKCQMLPLTGDTTKDLPEVEKMVG